MVLMVLHGKGILNPYTNKTNHCIEKLNPKKKLQQEKWGIP